jgi:hypothetical protein
MALAMRAWVSEAASALLLAGSVTGAAAVANDVRLLMKFAWSGAESPTPPPFVARGLLTCEGRESISGDGDAAPRSRHPPFARAGVDDKVAHDVRFSF